MILNLLPQSGQPGKHSHSAWSQPSSHCSPSTEVRRHEIPCRERSGRQRKLFTRVHLRGFRDTESGQ